MKRVNTISTKTAGRRPGNEDTKAGIIAAAQKCFAETGFDRATLRHIADDAAVDPALIVHYFGSKQGLFVAALLPLFTGPKKLSIALGGTHEEIGTRIATVFVQLTSEPTSQQLMLALFRSFSSDAQAAEMVRTFIEKNILQIVAPYVPGPNKALQANFIGMQFMGYFIGRYVLQVEPLASTTDAEMISYLAPRIQAAFTETADRGPV